MEKSVDKLDRQNFPGIAQDIEHALAEVGSRHGVSITMKPWRVRESAAETMLSIGILRPDKNRMYLLFPRFTSMVELAYDKGTGTDPAPPPKITKTLLGKETIGDASCQKSQLQVSESDGEQYDITVWESPNWNNFPVQMKIGSPPALVQFQDLHLEAPSSSLFEVPAGYAKYEGIQEIIQRKAEKPETTNVP